MSVASLFVVFHSGLHEDQYAGVEDRFVFAKVGDQPTTIRSDVISRRVVRCDGLPGFVPMGSHWAESEFLFAAYRTMLKDPSWTSSPWIGFLQYDNSIASDSGDSLVSLVEERLPKVGDVVVSLSPIDMGYEIEGNHIAMDYADPQKLQGDPRCYFPMIAQYNRFHGTNWKYQDLLRNPLIALCSSFIMRRERFMEMMRFCEYAISVADLDRFDPIRRHRMAGGLMERYYGTWIALQGVPLHPFRLKGLGRL